MKLGDAVEYGIKKTGLNRLAPKDCGCAGRKEKLNNFGCKKEDSKKAPTTKEGLTKEQRKTRKELIKKERTKAKQARKTGTETTETYEDSFYIVPSPKGGF